MDIKKTLNDMASSTEALIALGCHLACEGDSKDSLLKANSDPLFQVGTLFFSYRKWTPL